MNDRFLAIVFGVECCLAIALGLKLGECIAPFVHNLGWLPW